MGPFTEPVPEGQLRTCELGHQVSPDGKHYSVPELHEHRPLVAVVSSREVAAHPLTARVWVEQLAGESFDDTARRLAIADLERRARNHEQAADKLRAAIAQLRGEADA